MRVVCTCKQARIKSDGLGKYCIPLRSSGLLEQKHVPRLNNVLQSIEQTRRFIYCEVCPAVWTIYFKCALYVGGLQCRLILCIRCEYFVRFSFLF